MLAVNRLQIYDVGPKQKAKINRMKKNYTFLLDS